MKMKKWELIVNIMAISLLFHMAGAIGANARDIAEALSTGQSMINKIGVASLCIGISLGGILYTWGAAQLGRMIVTSGLVGAVFILAGPSIIGMVGKMFGVSV